MRKLNFLGALTVVGAVTLTGCGGKKREQKNVDTSMAQLEISTFDGGVGDEWLTNAANLFMEKTEQTLKKVKLAVKFGSQKTDLVETIF